MKKVTFIKENKTEKKWSQTLNPSPSMAASFIVHFIINLFLRNLLMSRVTVCYIAHIIVSITSLYLVHAFSNLSKLPFLVAVCSISL